MVDPLDQIIGQPLAVKQLNSLNKNNRIPHALLFTGPAGVGKFFTALQFAKSVNASKVEHKIDHLEEPFVKYILPLPRGKGEVSESSGVAKLSDKQLDELKSELEKKKHNPYYKISLDGAHNVKISSIREIRKFLSLEFEDISYRVIIIEEAHLMNSEAQNALLKSLEEPPDRVIFILITPYEGRLLPTIRSRCWEIKFKSLSQIHLTELLVHRFQINATEAQRVAVFSGGSLINALELLENDMSNLIESTIQVLRFSLGGWYNSAYIEIKKASNEFEKDKVKDIISLILNWLNDVQKNRIDFENYYFSDYSETMTRFNKNFPDSGISDVYHKIDELLQSMDKNILLNVIILNLILELHSIAIR